MQRGRQLASRACQVPLQWSNIFTVGAANSIQHIIKLIMLTVSWTLWTHTYLHATKQNRRDPAAHLDDGVVVCTAKRDSTRDHHIDNHAETPQVGAFRVALVLVEDFGCKIVAGPNHIQHLGVFLQVLPRKTWPGQNLRSVTYSTVAAVVAVVVVVVVQ